MTQVFLLLLLPLALQTLQLPPLLLHLQLLLRLLLPYLLYLLWLQDLSRKDLHQALLPNVTTQHVVWSQVTIIL